MPRGRPITVTLRPTEARALLRAAKVGALVMPHDVFPHCKRGMDKLRTQIEIVKGEGDAR